jgi:hypothetical protein
MKENPVTLDDARRLVALLRSYQKHVRGIMSTTRRVLALLAESAPEDSALRSSTLATMQQALMELMGNANVTALLATREPHEPLPNDQEPPEGNACNHVQFYDS